MMDKDNTQQTDLQAQGEPVPEDYTRSRACIYCKCPAGTDRGETWYHCKNPDCRKKFR
jgi:hypothetical protein